MPFEWNMYVTFELESWWNVMSTSHDIYSQIEQTSEALREKYKMYRAGDSEFRNTVLVAMK